MSEDKIQSALFAAYDLRNTLSQKEKRRPISEASFGETIGDSLDEVIAFLEDLERAHA